MKNVKGVVYVNGRFLGHKMDGIGRFSLEICKQLKRLNLDFKIVIPKGLDYKNEFGFEIIEFGNLKSHFWEQIDLLRFLKSNGSLLLLNLSGLGPLFYKNQIITIHDLSFYENKKWFSKVYTLFYSLTTPILARSALKKILRNRCRYLHITFYTLDFHFLLHLYFLEKNGKKYI